MQCIYLLKELTPSWYEPASCLIFSGNFISENTMCIACKNTNLMKKAWIFSLPCIFMRLEVAAVWRTCENACNLNEVKFSYEYWLGTRTVVLARNCCHLLNIQTYFPNLTLYYEPSSGRVIHWHCISMSVQI